MLTLTPTQDKYLPYVLAVALFMQILDATILNTSLPQMAQALGESPLKMQWAVISYALTLAIFIPTSFLPMINPAIPIGMLIKNIQCQLAYCTI